MNEQNQSGESGYERFEELVLERDRLEKEALRIERAYLSEFGALITDVFEEKIEYVKLRKMISFCREAADRGERPDSGEMIAYLQRELAEYYADLRDLLDRNEAVQMPHPVVTEYEESRIHSLYRHLAKQYHPETHPETASDPRLRELWMVAAGAYRADDLQRLVNTTILMRKAVAARGSGETLRAEVPDMAVRTERLKDDITEICSTEPFIWIAQLRDDETRAAYRETLEEELALYREYRAELETELDGLMD